MMIRVISSLVGLPILAFFVIWGGIPLQVALIVVSIIGVREVLNALSVKQLSLRLTSYAFTVLYLALIDIIHTSDAMTIVIVLFMLVLCFMLVVFHQSITIVDCMVTHFSFYYVTVMLSMIYLVRMIPNTGAYTVWLIFISAWGCDTGAYLVGKAIGKRKLIPTLSPNKTVEGAIGGVFGAALVAVIFGAVLTLMPIELNIANKTLLRYAAVGAGGAVFAQFGDLAASAIKRYTKIKDFGNIMPGHGGVLDRFDSVLFTAPAVYLLSILLIK